jgi:hypothetical protein
MQRVGPRMGFKLRVRRACRGCEDASAFVCPQLLLTLLAARLCPFGRLQTTPCFHTSSHAPLPAPCPPGTFSTSPSPTSACTTCGAGSTSDVGASSCTCGFGYLQWDPNTNTCPCDTTKAVIVAGTCSKWCFGRELPHQPVAVLAVMRSEGEGGTWSWHQCSQPAGWFLTTRAFPTHTSLLDPSAIIALSICIF